jgi:pyridoxine 4-dehydrogenase
MHLLLSEEGLTRSIDNILSKLRGKKHLDLFECARVDPTRPIEETVGKRSFE